MEDCPVNIENGNTSKFVNVELEQNSSVSTDSFSTSFTNSSWNSSGEAHIFSDPFEGILHRTHASEAKFSIEFISSRFFDAFRQKIHADYMSSVISMRPVMFPNVLRI